MRIRWVVAGLVLVLLAGSTAAAAQAEKKAAAAKPGAQPAYDLRALMQKILDAWGTLDTAKAAPFYAQGPGHVYYDITPMEYKGWAEYAEGVKKVFADYSSAKFTLGKDARVHRHGNLAWGAATWHAELLKKDGSKDTMDGRWTAVWEKRGDDWIIVHDHFSVPLPPPPPKK